MTTELPILARKRLEILATLDETLTQYHKIFCKTYPNHHRNPDDVTDEPKELWELAVQAQGLLIALGPKAVRRFNRLGFSLYFGSDNPADRHDWVQMVVRQKVNSGAYFSIEQRIEGEMGRLRICLQRGALEEYEGLDDDAFLLSAEKKYPFLFDAPME